MYAFYFHKLDRAPSLQWTYYVIGVPSIHFHEPQLVKNVSQLGRIHGLHFSCFWRLHLLGRLYLYTFHIYNIYPRTSGNEMKRLRTNMLRNQECLTLEIVPRTALCLFDIIVDWGETFWGPKNVWHYRLYQEQHYIWLWHTGELAESTLTAHESYLLQRRKTMSAMIG